MRILSDVAAMARWFQVPLVPGRLGVAKGSRGIALCHLSPGDIDHGRDNLSQDAQAPTSLVQSDVVDNEPEEWRKCFGIAAESGIGQL